MLILVIFLLPRLTFALKDVHRPLKSHCPPVSQHTTTTTTHEYCHFWELTKRDELSLRMVLALPNASIAGLASMIWSSKEPCVHDHHNIVTDEGKDGRRTQQRGAGGKTHAFLYGFPQSCDNGKVLDDPLGVYRLPCTRLSANTHTHTHQLDEMIPSLETTETTIVFQLIVLR